ncbi:4'-phosphopantetheinyl transferase family protein [Pseudoalteromonas sp. SSM20]|uniref:4'-phosphopantetheinyl transferase family protein n=1 Tax=Pseudoalteromonas sp. SSM20 TaxID=3139394 RepID=UPI003BAC128F
METINNKKPPITGNSPERAHFSVLNPKSPINLVIANSQYLNFDQINIESILSPSEIAIMQRRKSDSAKREYLASRYLIKCLAQQYFAIELKELTTFFDEPSARLVIKYQNSTLPLSLVISHSKGWVAVYLASTPERMGIDLEFISEKRPFLKLAKHFYHIDEINEIERANPMSDTFFRIWTLKEALAKAIAVPIAKLLAPNVYEGYANNNLLAYSCQTKQFDFSLAAPATVFQPPALIEVLLKPNLTGFEQTAVNRLHNVI